LSSSSSSSSSSRSVRFASPQRLTHGSPVIFHSPHRRRSGIDEVDDEDGDDDSTLTFSSAATSSVHSKAAFGGFGESALSTSANAYKAATKHDSIRTEMGDWFSTDDIRSAMYSHSHSNWSSLSSSSSSSSSSFRTLRLPVRALMPSAAAAAQTTRQIFANGNRTRNQHIADGGDSDVGNDEDNAFSIPTFTSAAAASATVFNASSALSSLSSSHYSTLCHQSSSALPLLPSWHSIPSSTLQTMLQRAIPIQWKLSRVGDVQQLV
jgi:hypothetical protein